MVGLTLAAVGGVAFGHAWTLENAPFWWVGAVTLLAGCLLVVSGLYARSRPAGVAPKAPVREEPVQGGDALVSLLGALLVYKYQWITHKQLNEALQQQRKDREDRRQLGDILVEMGAITQAQLYAALKFQHSLGRDKKAVQVH